jgi:MFS family permease
MQNAIGRDAWITLAILSSIALITMYGETMLLPAIPDIVREFNIPYNTSSWILTAYLITGAVMTPVVGKLSDMYGKKKLLLIIMIVYSVGTLLGGFSYNIFLIIIARILQGIGMAMFPVAFGIIREKFPPNKLSIGQGLFTAVFAAGSVVGLGLGAAVVEYFGWQMTFWSIVPFATILFLIILKYIQVESDKVLSKMQVGIDIKGVLVLSILLSSFLIALTLLADSSFDLGNTNNNNNDNNLIYAITLLVLSVILVPMFIILEKGAKYPLIDIKLLRDSVLLPTNVLIMTIGISIFIVYQTMPILVRSPPPLGFGGGPVDAANVQLPFMLLSLIVSVLSGFLISRFGNLKLTMMGTVISCFGFFILFFYHSTEFIISVNLSIIAIGLSLAEVGAFNIALLSSPGHQSGTSLGITVLLFLIGMAVGPAISGIYLEMFRSKIEGVGGSFPSLLSYNLIFLTAALISIISVVLSALITKRLHAIIPKKFVD